MGNVELYVLSLSYVTTVYVAKKYQLSEESVRNTLKTLSSFVHVVDMTAADTLAMLNTDWTDYEDSIQHQVANNLGVDYIITGNIKDFVKSNKTVLTPQQYIEL